MSIFFRAALLKGMVLCLVLVSGCSPSTEISATWINPEAGNKNYDNVLVVAMTDRVNIKQTAEDALVEELTAQGINAIRSIDEFPPSLQKGMVANKEELLQLVQENRHDAILTVAVVDEETETRHVAGAGGFAPMGRFDYYGNFWGYYSHSPAMYQQGYYQEDKIYFIETNLYDAETERLVWSAQSETVNPGRLDREARKYAEVTVNELTKKNLFKPAPAPTADAAD